MSLAKSEGGMGFRNFIAMNKALLARQGWRILKNPDSFCAKILKGLYFPRCSFLEAVKGHRASWAWFSLLHGREILSKGLRWQVQKGRRINFWEDKWIPTMPNFTITLPKPVGVEIEWVANAIDENSKCWNKAKLEQLISKEEVDAIVQIPISLFQREDSLIWHFTSNGAYSVKSGYHVAVKL